jgi:hypothetical protein
MSDKSYVDDVGTVVLVDTGSDIQTATTTNLLVKKPDGTEVTWTGTLSGTDSITYTIVADDFDQAGTYSLQSYVETAAWQGSGETVTFIVYSAFA